MSRFVRPETSLLRISGGDTLTVKRRLNAGEQRRAFAKMSVQDAAGDLRVDRLQVGIAMVLAYLLDWTITDDNGAVVAIRDQPIDTVAAVLDDLEPESYEEIRDAIERHDAKTRAEREKEKNARDGASGSSATSPSPDGATGDMNGSQHLTLTSTTSS